MDKRAHEQRKNLMYLIAEFLRQQGWVWKKKLIEKFARNVGNLWRENLLNFFDEKIQRSNGILQIIQVIRGADRGSPDFVQLWDLWQHRSRNNIPRLQQLLSIEIQQIATNLQTSGKSYEQRQWTESFAHAERQQQNESKVERLLDRRGFIRTRDFVVSKHRRVQFKHRATYGKTKKFLGM